MRGAHKAGYRKPRTGERRRQRKPLLLDRDPKAQALIQARRAAGDTWEQIGTKLACASEESVTPAAIKRYAERARRWYDLRMEQVNAETLRDAQDARELAAAFARMHVEPDAAINALYVKAFKALKAGDEQEKRRALAQFVKHQADLLDARAKDKRAEVEGQKLKLAEKKFEDLKRKAEKELNAAKAKLESGKQLTAADIERLRERTFGRPAA